MKRAFTLLELIIVIIIVGILAVVGLTQYTNVLEKSRQSEARAAIGVIRENALSYRLDKGTTTGMTDSNVGIGSDIPSSCAATHYFYYHIDYNSDPSLHIAGCRCTSGGKFPQGTSGGGQGIWLDYNVQTGSQVWHTGPTSCGS